MNRGFAGLALLAVAGAAAACEPGLPRNCMSRGTSGDLRLVVCSEPIFPYAREVTRYRAIVRDAESGEPIENGEGQIYATSRDGINRWDALLAGEEVGTYYGELNYLTAGQWGVAVRFRRDSTQPLWEFHWQQTVQPSREPAYPGDTT